MASKDLKAKTLIDVFNLFKPEEFEHFSDEQSEAFYQQTAAARRSEHQYEYHDYLYSHIIASDYASSHSRLLVVGHRGCGKSTEILQLMKKLSADSIPAIRVEATDDFDIYNFSYVDLFIAIVDKILKYSKANGLKIDPKIMSAFQEALSTKLTEEYWDTKSEIGVEGKLPLLLAKITSSFKLATDIKKGLRHEIGQRIYDIIECLNTLITHLGKQTSHEFVVIIDGLEKCRQECVRQLFTEDIAIFSAIKAHLVVAYPIAVYQSKDGRAISGFSAPEVMPIIKVRCEDGALFEGGIGTIRELILKRADMSFFEEGVLEEIITKGGGNLWDTCIFLSNSAFEAFMRKRTTVDIDSVKFTLSKHASDIFFRVDAALFPRVKAIYHGDHTAKQDAELSELLYTGAVLMYNGKNWVDLHPLLRDYINSHPEVVDV